MGEVEALCVGRHEYTDGVGYTGVHVVDESNV